MMPTPPPQPLSPNSAACTGMRTLSSMYRPVGGVVGNPPLASSPRSQSSLDGPLSQSGRGGRRSPEEQLRRRSHSSLATSPRSGRVDWKRLQEMEELQRRDPSAARVREKQLEFEAQLGDQLRVRTQPALPPPSPRSPSGSRPALEGDDLGDTLESYAAAYDEEVEDMQEHVEFHKRLQAQIQETVAPRITKQMRPRRRKQGSTTPATAGGFRPRSSQHRNIPHRSLSQMALSQLNRSASSMGGTTGGVYPQHADILQRAQSPTEVCARRHIFVLQSRIHSPTHPFIHPCNPTNITRHTTTDITSCIATFIMAYKPVTIHFTAYFHMSHQTCIRACTPSSLFTAAASLISSLLV